MDEVENFNVHGFRSGSSFSLLGELSFFSLRHSLSLARHLIAFGYGIPHAINLQQSSDLYSIPNVTTYLRLLYSRDGYRIFLIGLDTNLVVGVLESITSPIFPRFLQVYFPDFGGKQVRSRLSEYDMSENQSIRVHVRAALKEFLYTTILSVVQRPFLVVLARQIAQYTIGEVKYQGVFHSLRLIGAEEGVDGLFAGLIPSILHGLYASAAFWSLRHVISRWVVHLQRFAVRRHCSRTYETAIYAKAALPLLFPLMRYRCDTMFYRLDGAAKIMALVGSGLDIPISRYHHPILSSRRSAIRRHYH